MGLGPRTTLQGLPIHTHSDDGRGGSFLNPGALEFIDGYALLGALYAQPFNSAQAVNVNDLNLITIAPNTVGPLHVRFTANATFDITGIDITPQIYDGALLVLSKSGTGTTNLRNENAGSLAPNRMHLGADIAMVQNSVVILMYDQVPDRWLLVASTVSSGGALVDHIHDASGHGGPILLPNTVEAVTSLKSDTLLEIAGQAYAHALFASPAAGTYNDVSLITAFGGANPVMLLTPAGNVVYTGIAISDFTTINGVPLICLVNGSTIASGFTWTIKDANAGSIVANRYKGNGIDLVLAPGQAVWLTYDTNSSKWVSIDGPEVSITSTAGPDANITIDAAGAAGTAGTFARSQHGHQVVTTDAPSGANISIDAAASAAATGAIARAAHGHRLNTSAATPAAINKTPVAGTATHSPSRDDHSHGVLGNQVQTVRASTGALAAAGVIDVTITWPVTFGDTNYTVVVSTGYNDATARAAPTHYIRWETMTATSIKVRVVNNSAVTETMPVHAIGIHD
jgi:hypothetical protein